MSAKTSNHAKAPECAAFVKSMREVFGEVSVLWVKEGDFEMGESVALRNVFAEAVAPVVKK